MSGPKSSSYELSSSIVRAAQEAALKKQQEKERREALARAAEQRRLQRLAQANADARRARSRLDVMQGEFDRFKRQFPSDAGLLPEISSPQSPDEQDTAALEKYAQEVDKLLTHLGQHLEQQHANSEFKQATAVLTELALAPPKNAAELLNVTLKQAQEPLKNDISVEVSKLTERLREFAAEDVSPKLRDLLQKLAASESHASADLYGTEIRFQIQQIRESNAKRNADIEVATKLQSALVAAQYPDHLPLIQELSRVVAGSSELTTDLSSRAENAIKDIEARNASQTRAMTEAFQRQQAGDIVNGVLNDLGYDVEEMTHTLFAEGGVAHFRDPDWDKNYFVRMRVVGGRNELVFNLIRAADSDDKSIHAKQDLEMENEWCGDKTTGFNKLRTLAEARGLKLTMLRQIAPGQLPVQAIDKAKAPQIAGNAQSKVKGAAKPLARSLP
jgi:hypothetical protein